MVVAKSAKSIDARADVLSRRMACAQSRVHLAARIGASCSILIGGPVGPVNEWYRLRAGLGASSTRETYLRVLTPFFGFLHLHKWDWDAEPPLVREYTRAYLQAIGCVLRRDRERDGFSVAVTARAPLSPGSLALFLAAARDLYEVLIEGEWDAQANANRSYYAHSNPMYSEVLRRWKRDHVRFIQNAGAPDWVAFAARADQAASIGPSATSGFAVRSGNHVLLDKPEPSAS